MINHQPHRMPAGVLLIIALPSQVEDP